jgi:hypothetical protein
MLAVSLILWVLAVAIVALVAHPTLVSFRGSAIALWICAMVTTLVGAYVGGFISGYLPGNPQRAIGITHGFLAWCVAFVLAFMFEANMASTVLRAAAAQATAAAFETTGAAAAAAAGSNMPLAQRAESTLGSVGYPREEGRRIVVVQQARPGRMVSSARDNSGPSARNEASDAAKVGIDYAVAIGWSWFGTWAIAGLLAMSAATAGAKRVARPSGLGAEPTSSKDRPPAPLTPVPT